MLRFPRTLTLGAMLWAGGVAALALHLTSDGPSARLLASTEMRDVARGAAPGPCTHLLIHTTCGDRGGDNNTGAFPCRFKPQAICQRRCFSCTNLNAPHSYYTNKQKPWNAWACQPGGVPGGCGLIIGGARCQWLAAQQICICAGGQVQDAPCFQGQPICQFDCVVIP